MSFGDRLKEVRGRFGTRAELALRLGVHQNTIAQWERGEQYPDAREITLILEACPIVDPTWLLTGEGEFNRKDGPLSGGAIREALQEYRPLPQFSPEVMEIAELLENYTGKVFRTQLLKQLQKIKKLSEEVTR